MGILRRFLLEKRDAVLQMYLEAEHAQDARKLA
ncbi:hypothetical protein C404_04140 [Ralstonia sp. AU12-08]|nr:hypothetical protein C404_04140 [Ralstonia sp. AU12-08]